MGGGAAEHALALPERGLDRVEGDGTDDGEAHSGAGAYGARAVGPRDARDPAAEFGGPEVLKLVDLPVPEPGDGRGPHQGHARGAELRRHPPAPQRLPGAGQQLPLIPGAEVAGVREDTGERVVALCGTGGYAEYATAPEALTFPIPDGVDDGTALALLIQGLTAWHLYRTCGARCAAARGRRARGGRRRRLARRAARQADGRRARDRHRVDARTSARWRSSSAPTPRSTPRPRAWRSGCVEANVGEPVDVVFEMAGGAVFDAVLRRAGAVRPPRRLRHRLARAERGPHGHAHAPLARVVGFWLMHCLGRPAMVDEALADLFARAARGELRAVVGATYPLERGARRRRSTWPSAAPPASCCSTPTA